MTPTALFQHAGFAFLLLLLAAAGTWLMRRYGRILDHPNARSSHAETTPRGGGVAIVITFLIGVATIGGLGEESQIHQRYFWAFLISSLLIAAISLYDDIQEKTFQIKLATHVIAIVLAISAGLQLRGVIIPGMGNSQFLLAMLSFLWLLGLTNAYNFMDGLDGIAASTAVIAALFFAMITFEQGSSFMYLVSLVVAAASAGFLIFNWPKGSIFMGDVGSAFLGFVLAAMAIMAASFDRSHTSFFVMPLLLLHFLFDTIFTMGRRILAGENPARAHCTHLYQLLVQMGKSHRQVTLIYSGLGLAQGAAAMLMVHILGTGARLWCFVPFILGYTAAAIALTRRARHARFIA
ncbi:MAG: glycosyltransferase family 4 protein [Mariprofundales bacterium]|nr:glycosyltransferase family 4 protein [Mariprofundales bacterium]